MKLENSGLKQRGPAAQDVTIDIVLPPGATVLHATGDGYRGVQSDPVAKADRAEWQLARIAPDEARTFTLTLSSPAQGLKGSVRWTKPAPKSGAKFDTMNFVQR